MYSEEIYDRWRFEMLLLLLLLVSDEVKK